MEDRNRSRKMSRREMSVGIVGCGIRGNETRNRRLGRVEWEEEV